MRDSSSNRASACFAKDLNIFSCFSSEGIAIPRSGMPARERGAHLKPSERLAFLIVDRTEFGLYTLLSGFFGIRADETLHAPILRQALESLLGVHFEQRRAEVFLLGCGDVPSYHLEIFSFISRHEFKASPGGYADTPVAL